MLKEEDVLGFVLYEMRSPLISQYTSCIRKKIKEEHMTQTFELKPFEKN